ncbi:MAG: hypothetical protein ACLP1X_07925 [Polyangiaceae bacterium]
MGWRAWLLGMGASGLAGCNPSLADYCAQGTPECSPADAAARDGNVAVGSEAAADASACDPTKAPHDASCVITEAYGVFVSPAGSDSNVGTRAAPARTIGHGMDLAKAAGKRVYVCAGSFQEQLVAASTRDGVSVYGALDCATWSYAAANKVVVAPAAAGYALELEGLRAGTTFEDLEFDAQNAAPGVAGGSSVAVFASSSRNIALQRVVMVAGNATDGTSGASPGGADGGGSATNWYGTPPGYAELDGKSAGDAGAAPATTCVCPDQSSSTGGAGGGPLNTPTPTAGLPSWGDAGAGAGGMNAVVCGNGGSPTANGADAPINAADTPSSSLGACSASGWSPGVGVAGADGKPGQGGGGGGNGRLSNGSGGGGACGGCGGAGGQPGQAGGSSIALLSYQSSITLESCVLTAKAAGNGGAGGSGEPGEGGGGGGFPAAASGCAGGGGGAGAGGNGGQGGPGGLSLGVGYAGTAPTISGAVVSQAASYPGITLGTAGAGGASGSRGAAAANSTGTSGVDGIAGPSGLAAAVGALP